MWTRQRCLGARGEDCLSHPTVDDAALARRGGLRGPGDGVTEEQRAVFLEYMLEAQRHRRHEW
jgi:hypothetical protein